MKKCPFCAEKIADEAIVCRFCGRELTTPKPIIITQSTQPQYITSTLVYDTELAMRAGISKMAKYGWEVKETTEIHRGWAPGKTCCLGVIFLPLALFGKKGNHYQVIFQKRLLSEYEINSNLKSKNIEIDGTTSSPVLEKYSTLLKEDIQTLNQETDNPAAVIVLGRLQKDQGVISERMKYLEAQRILAKRNVSSYDIEMSNNEADIKIILDALQSDLVQLNTAPKIPIIITAINDASALKLRMENHLDNLITARVSNNLASLSITAPYSSDLAILNNQTQQIDEDISELISYKKVQGLEPVRKSVQSKKKDINRRIRTIKWQNLWGKVIRKITIKN